MQAHLSRYQKNPQKVEERKNNGIEYKCLKSHSASTWLKQTDKKKNETKTNSLKQKKTELIIKNMKYFREQPMRTNMNYDFRNQI